jgi:phospholipase D1/2
MAGRPYRASRFAAQLRRFLFRKHLGLIRPQDYTREDNNRLPVGMGGPKPSQTLWQTPSASCGGRPLTPTPRRSPRFSTLCLSMV